MAVDIDDNEQNEKLRDIWINYKNKLAIEYDKPIRIGVNWGSLDQDLLKVLMDENAALKSPLPAASVMKETLIRSVLDSAISAESIGVNNFCSFIFWLPNNRTFNSSLRLEMFLSLLSA